MANFHWKGIQGTQYLSGEIEGLTEDEAAFKLTQQGIIITQLLMAAGEKPVRPKKTLTLPQRKKKIPPKDVLILTRKTATMLKAGLPILQTLAMLRDQTENPTLQEVMRQIYASVESGKALSAAFAEHDTVFDAIYINLIKAGEASGKLDLFLEKLVQNQEKTIKIRAAIKGALMYPTILMTVAVGVLGVMMVFVVPVFAGMYGNSGMALPAPTQIILNISDFLRNPLGGGVLALALVGSVIGFKQAIKRNLSLRRRWHAYLLRMPLFGNLILKSALARIAMVQGNLAAAGVPVLESLDIASSSSTNLVMGDAMEAVKRGVFSGSPLSQLLREQAVIPRTYADMVEVGERTGNMQEMLGAISGYYEDEFDTEVDHLSALMEPIMIVFLGTTIGFILVAMYLPIFKMGQAVTG